MSAASKPAASTPTGLLPRRGGLLFAYSRWDLVPALAGVAHFAYVLLLFWLFPRLSWWEMVPLALIYSILISWNINGVSHNFIHNPYFRSAALNRAYSLLLSLTMAFSQTMYEWVHMRHHSGNMDRPDETGQTIDPISIYRFGRNGQPENVVAYTALSYFRDDPAAIYRHIKARRPADAYFSLFEIACVVVLYGTLAILDWRAALFMVPFYYFGHSLSSLNGFYEHYRANPDLPIAWGVSSYGWLYNVTWFYNGYHAEHHYRPKFHWTKMKALHRQIAAEQRAAGVRVISAPHVLGFLDRQS